MKVVITIFLARLLTPEDFGTIAMITILTGLSKEFVSFGFSSAIVQNNKITQKELSSIFWFNTFVGFILMVLVCIMANQISIFYDNKNLITLTYMISTIYFIDSVSVVQNAIFRKEMQFRQLAYRDLVSVFASGAIAILLAVNNFNYWSIAWQLVSRSLFFTFIIWFTSNWRPSNYFSFKTLKKSLKFSSYIFANNIFNYFTNNIDNILIGKIFGGQKLGLYTKSYSFVNLPVKTLSSIFSKVGLPVFSKLNYSKKRMAELYFQAFFLLSFAAYVLMLPIFLDTHSFILIFFGEKWLEIETMTKFFSIAGIVSCPGWVFSVYTIAKGFPQKLLKVDVIKRIVIVAGILIGFNFGVMGIVIGRTISAIMIIPLSIFFAHTYFDLSISRHLRCTLMLLSNALLAYFTCSMFQINNIFLSYTVTSLITLTLYILLAKLFFRLEYNLIVNLIRSTIQ